MIDVRMKMVELTDEIGQVFLERESIIRAFATALLARKHVFMIGPPGTAKSTMIEKFCKCIHGAKYFEWLMDMFSQPEDLFGPQKLSKLKQDEYERAIEDTLVDSSIVFLDEIWKSHSGILNMLLRVMDGARRFYNNKLTIQTPLMTLIGASNELPEEGAILNALWDRFQVRLYVGDLVDDDNFLKVFMRKTLDVTRSMTLAELEQAQAEVEAIELPDAVGDLVKALRAKLRQAGFEFSVRRWRDCYGLLQANAWLEGRDRVTADDLEVLKDVFWSVPEDRKAVTKIISSMINPQLTRALELLDGAQDIYDEAMKVMTTKAGQGANKDFKAMLEELERMTGPRVEQIREQIEEMNLEVCRVCLGVNL